MASNEELCRTRLKVKKEKARGAERAFEDTKMVVSKAEHEQLFDRFGRSCRIRCPRSLLSVPSAKPLSRPGALAEDILDARLKRRCTFAIRRDFQWSILWKG